MSLHVDDLKVSCKPVTEFIEGYVTSLTVDELSRTQSTRHTSNTHTTWNEYRIIVSTSALLGHGHGNDLAVH